MIAAKATGVEKRAVTAIGTAGIGTAADIATVSMTGILTGTKDIEIAESDISRRLMLCCWIQQSKQRFCEVLFLHFCKTPC